MLLGALVDESIHPGAKRYRRSFTSAPTHQVVTGSALRPVPKRLEPTLTSAPTHQVVTGSALRPVPKRLEPTLTSTATHRTIPRRPELKLTSATTQPTTGSSVPC